MALDREARRPEDSLRRWPRCLLAARRTAALLLAYDASDEEVERALVLDYPDMGMHGRAGQTARITRWMVKYDLSLRAIPDEDRDHVERVAEAIAILDYIRDCGCDARMEDDRLLVFWALPGRPDYQLPDEVKSRINQLTAEIAELVVG